MQILDWPALSSQQRAIALARPAAGLAARTLSEAQVIIDAVRSSGDAALLRYAREFDGVTSPEFEVSSAEFAAARGALHEADIAALERAIANVDSFHRATQPTAVAIEVQPGVICER